MTSAQASQLVKQAAGQSRHLWGGADAHTREAQQMRASVAMAR